MRAAQFTSLTVWSCLVGVISLLVMFMVLMEFVAPLERQICLDGQVTRDSAHSVSVHLSGRKRFYSCAPNGRTFYVTPETDSQRSFYYWLSVSAFGVAMIAGVIPPLVRRSQRQWREY